MSGRYYAPSAGLGAATSLQAFLIQREQEERQARLDALEQQRVEAAIQADKDRTTLGQDTLALQREAEANRQIEAERSKQWDRDQFAISNSLGDEPVDAATAARYQATGLGSGLRTIPGVVQQGAQWGEDVEGVPQYEVKQPDAYVMAGSREARTQARATQAQAEREAESRRFEAEQNRLKRDLDADIARGMRGSEAADRATRKAIAEYGENSVEAVAIRQAIAASQTRTADGQVSIDPGRVAENYNRIRRALSAPGTDMPAPPPTDFVRDSSGRVVPSGGARR